MSISLFDERVYTVPNGTQQTLIRLAVDSSLSLVDKIMTVIKASPTLSFDVAVQQVGLGNMLTVYDVAQIKRVFVEAGRGSREGFGCLDDLERPYFWTNQYIGHAPAGHPAEGKLIIASVEEIGDMSVPATNIMSKLFGGSGSVKISSDVYVAIDTKRGCDHYFIKDFYKGSNDLMIPIFDQEGDSAHLKVVTFFGLIQVKGIGSDNINVVSFRPASWHHDLGFTNVDTPNFVYKVVPKSWLVDLV